MCDSVCVCVCVPGGEGGLDLVGVPAVRPEDEQPVEQRLDVGDNVVTLRVDLEQAPLLLHTHRHTGTQAHAHTHTHTQ